MSAAPPTPYDAPVVAGKPPWRVRVIVAGAFALTLVTGVLWFSAISPPAANVFCAQGHPMRADGAPLPEGVAWGDDCRWTYADGRPFDHDGRVFEGR
jgi:hypothetical protein